MFSKIAVASSLIAVASAQQIGTLTPEVHPTMTWQTCTAPGSCTTINGQVTIDANWRWAHSVSGSTNCYTGNTWDKTLCPDDKTCAANCAVDGANYQSTYGVTASGNSLRLNFVTTGSNTNVGSRLFLMADSTHYQMFKLLNQEFTFDVDVSHLPCGLNGALYMSGMAADGGQSQYPGAKAGAQYGVGYCDAQCPRDLKFINGEANVDGWTPESNSANSGNGRYGSCCAEMDIWEANSISTAVTPHPADNVTQTRCDGNACGGTYSSPRYGGPTDPDGCDFNSYRMGNKNFYGPGLVVDTNKPFTVVTQFLTDSGTASGTLNEIKRFYVQGGVVIPNSQSTIPGIKGNSINNDFCKTSKQVFNNTDDFNAHGGLAQMSKAYQQGMVLVMSLWDDYADSMLWLDSNDPKTGDPSVPGVARGTCPTTGGLPSQVESQNANAYVIYSNIKVGPINSTYSGTPYGGTGGTGGTGTTSSSTKITTSTSTKINTSTSTKSTTSASTVPTGTGGAAHYGQCGGIGWTGPTTCAGGFTCQKLNDYFYQCL